ncbi:MAG: hypothetical protein OEY86_17115 [Nitrospira sp.]|nr:hypothetical protein [Nitrospira sp.]
MPLIWAAISAHGFGHAAQVVPVLNALHRHVPDLRIILRTMVPATFFRNRLTAPWEISPAEQDIGCIQNGPLAIDMEATWRAHHRFHLTWDDRVRAEIEAMHRAQPDVILANTPYLAITAGAKAGIPTVALASLTWDLILSEFPAPPGMDTHALLRSIRRAYAYADRALRIAPAPIMDSFNSLQDIGPICEPGSSTGHQLTTPLQLAPGIQTVLVGFGGIPLTSLPFDLLDSLSGYRFLFDGPVPQNNSRFVSLRSMSVSFRDLLSSVDIIMTKPGYGTVLESVALRIPIVYVRRYHFADEQPLVEYLHRYGRGVELSQDDFFNGRWRGAIEAAAALPAPLESPPPPTGATDAAELLTPLFRPA